MNRVAVGFLVFLMVTAADVSGAAGERTEGQATVLDHNEFPCSNCLFGVSDYYVCFDVNKKIMIGHDKVRTQTWMKDPVDLLERGKTVPVSFDDKFIWVTRANGKRLRLKQDYTKKIFLNSDRCEAAVKTAN